MATWDDLLSYVRVRYEIMRQTDGELWFNLPTTGALLSVNDTVGSGDSLIVRMFTTTPFDGSTLTTATGLGGAVWSKLALSAPLPATFDSLVPFGLTMVVKQPDGVNWPDVIG